MLGDGGAIVCVADSLEFGLPEKCAEKREGGRRDAEMRRGE